MTEPTATPTPPELARRFGDRDVAKIITRAAELQQQETAAGVRDGDLSLSIERVVAGEVPESEYDVLVDEIRRTVGTSGLASALGRSMSWSSVRGNRMGADGRRVDVSIVPKNGRTVIRVEESNGSLAGGLFGGIMGGAGGGAGIPIGVGVGLGVMHSPVAALALVAGIAGSAYGLARSLFQRITGRRSRQLAQLADRLSTHAAAAIAAAVAATGATGEPAGEGRAE